MKNFILIIGLFIFSMFMISSVNAEIFAEQPNYNYECGAGSGDHMAFKISEPAYITNITIYGRTIYDQNTTVNYRIEKNSEEVDFSSDELVSNETVTTGFVNNESSAINLFFGEDGVFLQGDTIYWLDLGNNPDVCYNTEYNETTNSFLNGGINSINSHNDLKFTVIGNGIDYSLFDLSPNFTDYTHSQTWAGYGFSQSMIYFYPRDYNMHNISFRYEWEAVSQTINYMRIYEFNYEDCSVSGLVNVSTVESSRIWRNSSCWINQNKIFESDNGYNTPAYMNSDDDGDENTTLKGKNYYKFVFSLGRFSTYGTTSILRLVNKTKNNYSQLPHLYSTSQYGTLGGTENSNYDFVTEDIFYSEINGEYINSCTGEECTGNEINETFEDYTNATITNETDVDKAIGLLYNRTLTGDAEKSSSVTLKGLFISGIIIIPCMIAFVTGVSASPLLLAVILFKLGFLCVGMGFIPFYLILIPLVGFAGFKLFKYFTGGENDI